MTNSMLIAAVVALQVATAGLDPGRAACTAPDDAALSRAAELIERGDDPLASEARLQSSPDHQGCVSIELVRTSLIAWGEARALSGIAGDPAPLGPIKDRLNQFNAFAAGSLALDAEYARVAVQAAVAAAQDERGELELLLTHARDLSERLLQRRRPARWPRPFNLLAGELWLEVDRYDEARQAFERAARTNASSALAHIGLAEALIALQQRDEACRVIRQVRGAAGALAGRATRLATSCP